MSKELEKSNTLPTVRLNAKYSDELLKHKLQEAYKHCSSIEENGLIVYTKPFMCCHMPNFLENERLLTDLKDELLDLVFFEKNNDLYKFYQSDDLKDSQSPNISALRTFLYGDFRKWIQQITGFNLTSTVDMNCARYDYTDTLLCHDDMLEGRKIAYILYLVPNWKKEDGGMLDLFSSDEHGEPSDFTPVKSIIPEWNSFVFFEVSHRSFHQVSEVLTEDKTRLSISGWFYGDPLNNALKAPRRAPELLAPIFVEEQLLLNWINPSYLDPKTQMEIRLKFEADSEVELLGFLNEEKYNAVAAALQECSGWQTQGPINQRHLEMLDPSSLSTVVKECLDVLHSEAIFLIFSNITGLTLHKLAVEEEDGGDDDDDEEEEKVEEGAEEEINELNSGGPNSKRLKRDESGPSAESERNPKGKEVDAKCSSEIRRWKHGSYTLIHDDSEEGSEFALDAILFFNCADWHIDMGGYISYLAKDEDEELLSVTPQENALALVFRDKETVSFVKHINNRVNSRRNAPHFHTITSVYYE